jgi:hypothetical protein
MPLVGTASRRKPVRPATTKARVAAIDTPL